MILHFSHIGLTDGLTFMIPFGWSLRPGSGRRDGCRYRVVVLPSPTKLLGAFEQDSGCYQFYADATV
jgi:hypothetical protein